MRFSLGRLDPLVEASAVLVLALATIAVAQDSSTFLGAPADGDIGFAVAEDQFEPDGSLVFEEPAASPPRGSVDELLIPPPPLYEPIGDEASYSPLLDEHEAHSSHDASTCDQCALARLASMPNMLGDSFGGLTDLAADTTSYYQFGPSLGGSVLVRTDMDLYYPGTLTFAPTYSIDISSALAGGLRRMKAADNNKAVPQDQVIFAYTHFRKAVQTGYGHLPMVFTTRPIERQHDLNAFVVGFEKTLLGGLCSIGVRMPISADAPTVDAPYSVVEAGEFGNLNVNLKALAYYDDQTAVSIGLGVDTPTGSDADGYALGWDLTVKNQSFHLMPYIGFLLAPTNSAVFYQGFLQLDIPANGNSIAFDRFWSYDAALNDQPLLYLDFSTGYWLRRWPQLGPAAGVAALLELHYTTAMDDAEPVDGFGLFSNYRVGNPRNRFDIVNLSTGLHVALRSNCAVRVIGSFPLTDGDNRFYDAEVGIQTHVGF